MKGLRLMMALETLRELEISLLSFDMVDLSKDRHKWRYHGDHP